MARTTSDVQHNLLALPARSGGLGLTNPVHQALGQFRTSVKVTATLVKLILQQSSVYPFEAIAELSDIKSELTKRKGAHVEGSFSFGAPFKPLKKTKDLASEKGASSWLTALPTADHGFCLHKGAFRDALRYNRSPPLQAVCVAHHFRWIMHLAAIMEASHL